MPEIYFEIEINEETYTYLENGDKNIVKENLEKYKITLKQLNDKPEESERRKKANIIVNSILNIIEISNKYERKTGYVFFIYGIIGKKYDLWGYNDESFNMVKSSYN